MLLTSFLSSILYFSLAMNPVQQINVDNKTFPKSLEKEVLKALSFYPELNETSIEFKFKDKIKKSTMQAQPRFSSFFKNKKKREYMILISRNIQIDGENFTIPDIPSDVIVGWLGHELGHVMDYSERTNVGMLIFGIKYLFSSAHIKEVERAADTYAIAHGMGDYIIKTKNFILDNADLSEKYKARIRRLYISSEEVMELINENKIEEELEVVEEAE
ncbi:MAG TPA: hypothetical protein VKX40_16350 [Aequorivita sp.]|nr:hypothetical protein [Aequorivita sp.]